MMGFEEAVKEWLQKHIMMATGERKRRLMSKGLTASSMAFLRETWWPKFKNFDDLYPEYEVHDTKDGVRYIDFAYIRPWFRIAIEIDDYNSHVREASIEKHADDLDRQNDLVYDGWLIMRFAVYRVKNKPRTCQSRIIQMLDRYLGEEKALRALTLEEREIVRHAWRFGDIKCADVQGLLDVGEVTSRKLLHSLASKKVLYPSKPYRKRVHSYVLANRDDWRLLG